MISRIKMILLDVIIIADDLSNTYKKQRLVPRNEKWKCIWSGHQRKHDIQKNHFDSGNHGLNDVLKFSNFNFKNFKIWRSKELCRVTGIENVFDQVMSYQSWHPKESFRFGKSLAFKWQCLPCWLYCVLEILSVCYVQLFLFVCCNCVLGSAWYCYIHTTNFIFYQFYE